MAALSDKLRIARSVERNSVTINFGDGPVVIYAKPLTGAEIDKIITRHPKFATNPTNAAIVDIIIMKAEVESGEPAFDVGDKAALLLRDIAFLTQIHQGLFPPADTDLTEEAVEAEAGN
jgi:hypothetical protein